MDYSLIISVCSILVMLFSAYVAYKTFKLQKDIRRPRLVYSKRKYEFQYYIQDDRFHLVQWLISSLNTGGETAIVDSIVFSLKINNVMYMGKVTSDQFKLNLVPPGASFIVDLSHSLGDKNTWNLIAEDNSGLSQGHSRTSGVSVTDIDPSEIFPLMMYDIPNMSYRALILYRLDGTDSSVTLPYGLKIGGSFKTD